MKRDELIKLLEKCAPEKEIYMNWFDDGKVVAVREGTEDIFIEDLISSESKV